MSESEHPVSSPASESLPAGTPAAAAPSELQALRALVIRLQSALIALTWIVGVFIFIQFWRARNELAIIRPQTAPMMEGAKRADPVVNQFLTQLVDYARTHPDVQPLLAKYPIQVQATGTNRPAAPAPAGNPPK
jgi:hypothetical protein